MKAVTAAINRNNRAYAALLEALTAPIQGEYEGGR